MRQSEHAITAFNDSLEVAKTALSEALGLVVEGRSPNRMQIDGLNEKMGSLREAYNDLRGLALELSGDCASTEEETGFSYINIIEMSEAEAIEERFEGLLRLLREFTRIESDGEDYERAISPFRKEAEEAIAFLGSLDDHALPDGLEESCEPKRLLVEAVKLEDFGSQEGEELLNALGPVYPWKVYQGVMLHKYSLPFDEPSRQCEAMAGLDSDAQTDAIDEVQDDASPEGVVPSEEAVKDEGLHLKNSERKVDDDCAGEQKDDFILPISVAREASKVSAASFKRDLLQNAPSSVRTLLPEIAVCGCIGAGQLGELYVYMSPGQYSSDDLESGIQFLRKRGIVSLFDTKNHECLDDEVLALSSYGCALLEKESIRLLKLGKRPYWTFSIDRGSTSYDDGLPLAFMRRRLERVQQLIGCYVMTESEDVEPRIGPISSITFDGENLRIRAKSEGRQVEFAVVGEGEEAPEGAEYVLAVTPIEEPDEELAPVDEAPVDVPGSGEPQADPDVAEPVDAQEDGSGATDNPTRVTIPESPGENIATSEELKEGVLTLAETAGTETSPNPEEASDLFELAKEEGPEPEAAVQASPSITKDAEEEHGAPTGIEALLDTGSLMTASCPTDDGFVSLATYMLDHPEESTGSQDYGAVACAIAMLESGSLTSNRPHSERMLRQLGLAADVRAKGDDYTGSTLARGFGEFNAESESLILSAYCRALFNPKNPFDYELWNTCETLASQYDDYFPSYPELRPLMSKLLEIHEASPARGFNERVLDTLDTRADRSARLEEMRRKADALQQKPVFKAKLHGMPEFIELCFGKESDLSFCMSVIKDDSRSDIDLVRGALSEYLDASGQLDSSHIEEKIDTTWRVAVADKNTKGIRRPEFYARKQAVDAFEARLGLMEEWVSYVEGSADDKSIAKLGEIRRELVAILADCAESLRSTAGHRSGQEVVLLMLDSLNSRLAGEDAGASIFDEFLLTGFISVKDNGLPDIDASHNSVRYFEPWRRVLRHWLAEKPSMEEAAAAICRDGEPSTDNLRQLRNIERVLGHTATEVSKDEMLSSAQKVAEHEGGKFSERLEVAYAFGEIDEPQRELLQGLLSSNRDAMFESEEFGLWRQLISSLVRQISDMSSSQGRQLAARLERCEEAARGQRVCDLLMQARTQLTEARNYAVVEEYLNRFEAGERKLPDSYSEEDSFAEFISDEVYGPLLEVCQRGRSQQFARFAKQYVHDRYPADWSTRHKGSAERLIASWPCSGKRKPEPTTIAQLFRQLGFNVKGASQPEPGREHYLLEVRPEKRNQSDYTHPIAMFGTQARSPLDVIVLHGNQSAREIVNQVSSARINGMSVVVVDGCLSLQTRRQVAEIFHTSKSKVSPFLLIDQVLALHLSLHQETERLPILLKCTLPFTYYQPFIRDGGATADEMFSGRESELRTIIDPRGATIVYGGRQLGKTALLERAEGLQHDPEKGRFAILVNIQQCLGEKEFVRQVTRTMNRKASLEIPETDSIEDLCDQLRKVLDRDSVRFVLLLIDEADRFLESISTEDYMPIKPLVDLKRERSSEFKFVLAGLHNVVRYKNATANNGIFGQLGLPLCVKPLKPADALRLMSRPLGYLGFDVKRYPHIETILTNTNYYPGILQFFGYELVDTMTKQYGQYYKASLGNPPYSLTQEQLGSIMNSRRLNDSIKEKFLLSLRLDPRYMAIARCVALLTQEREGDTASELSGLSASEVLECGREWEVAALSEETVGSATALMDEMVDMGILSKSGEDQGGYRLRMHRFLSIIGSTESILEAFVSGEVE